MSFDLLLLVIRLVVGLVARLVLLKPSIARGDDVIAHALRAPVAPMSISVFVSNDRFGKLLAIAERDVARLLQRP